MTVPPTTGAHLDAAPVAAPTVSRDLIRRAVVGIVVFLAIAGVLGWLLRAPMTEAGTWFVDAFGLAGLFAAVTLVDASPVPMTNEPLVVLALGGGMDVWGIFAIVSAASVFAGLVGHTSGRILCRVLPIRDMVHRFSPEAAAWIETRGAWGVAVAALLPIPYALATWTAGAMNVPLRDTMLASLLRVPKTAFYVALLAAGWAAGA